MRPLLVGQVLFLYRLVLNTYIYSHFIKCASLTFVTFCEEVCLSFRFTQAAATADMFEKEGFIFTLK